MITRLWSALGAGAAVRGDEVTVRMSCVVGEHARLEWCSL